MVSYYNSLPYTQKHSAANLAYSAGQPWQWPANYHTGPPNHQFLGDIDTSPHAAHHQMYYGHHMFHTAAAGAAASEWHSPTSSAESFPQNIAPSAAHQLLQQQQHHHHHQLQHTNGGAGGGSSGGGGGGGANVGSNSSASSGSSSVSGSAPGATINTQLNDTPSSIGEQQQQQQHIAEGLPSPPITVSGSEISSPGAPASSLSPHHGPHHLNSSNNNNSPSANNNNTIAHNNNNLSNHRSSPVKAQYYDWMKKPAYTAQPTPGKTRTKDKYRVVYTDFQRLELEKEYCSTRYITIRRKTELAQSLSLSERQVKIWFQNRRAKERKQSKKGSDPTIMGGGGMQHSDYLMETKPKLEPGLQHLQHSLHSMSSMAVMSMPPMSLHQHLHGHHSLAAVSAAAAHSHQLHQSPHHHAAAASVGSLSM